MASTNLSEFYRLSKPKRPPCQVGLLLKGEIGPELGPTALKQFKAALDVDKGIITSAAIQQWLAARGHEMTVNRISNHRRKVCDCA